MILVIVITGIIGGIVAVFLRLPVQGYVDSARRAEMTDIADTALRRISRDLRIALPNSVRVAGPATAQPPLYRVSADQGRYRAGMGGDELDFSADNSFECWADASRSGIGTDQIVVYKQA
jgi:MSHA biogenesis protein MshO